MVLIKNCLVHNLPVHLLCSINQSPQLLCQKCMGEHHNQPDHHTAISLNSITLNYFALFTAHIADHMHKWSRLVQSSGFRRVFEVRGKDGGVWRCEDQMVVGRCAVKVMQEHAELMMNNNRYVASNQETEGLYHPQCLRDIYNLAAQHWQANAQLLIIKLEGLLWQFCGKECQVENPVLSINHLRIAQIENYREELLSKWREDIFRESKGYVKEKKRQQSQETIGSQKSKASCMDANEVSPFEVPQVSLPQTASNQETLMAENKLLRQQNTSLKCQNVLLQQDCNILREKCIQLQSQRRYPSSSKKRSQVSLQSQLLSQIVQLQAQLYDSHHDLQLLINYLNQLASRGIIPPLQLKQRLLPLKTVTLL